MADAPRGIVTTGSCKTAVQTFLESLGDCETAQRELLINRLITPNKDCEFGRRSGFSAIRSVSDFRNAVPVRSYEDLSSSIDRMANGERNILTSEPVRRFFITSGSMDKPKYIPVTPSFIRDKSRAFQVFWNLVREAYPRVAGHNFIFNFADTADEHYTPGGLPCSSESSFWNACWRGGAGNVERPLPREIMKIPDSETRYYTIARIMLETDLAVLMSLNPSTILLLSEVIRRNAPRLIEDVRCGGLSAGLSVTSEVKTFVATRFKRDPIRARQLERALANREPLSAALVWPNLQLAVSWRSPMVRPYIELLQNFLGSIPQRDYLTMASEGIIAIPFVDGMSGGALPIHTHFYEFKPEESSDQELPATLLAHELETGRNYVVVLSTSAGMYRYNLGDVVQVREFVGSTPVIEFLHRTGRTCSLSGEKLTESQVAGAVGDAATQVCLRVKEFTLSPAARPYPHYVLSAEVETPFSPRQLIEFLAALDQHLGLRNIEYQSKRSSHRLGSPELCVLRQGSHAILRQQRIAGGANDAQVKMACLTRDLNWHNQFEALEHISCESAA
jgi:hypothetical protein